jgi:hypothetical protein
VREVGVHLEQQAGPLLDRPAEAGDVGRPEPALVRPVQDRDLGGRLGGEAVGDRARAVGRGVVDDEDAEARRARGRRRASRAAATIAARLSASS